MTLLEILQNYWWLLISVLGAVLVFLLMVQGGQTMLLSAPSDIDRTMMVNSLGRKWELTFTTLVVFGGAFFASFPLFYSTSFGGAYWLWMLILFSFVLQAVSYEFRSKPGNLFGCETYDTCLFFNGCVGCVLLGVAVGMMFFGAEFNITMGNILDTSSPVISTWAPTHGLEAIVYWPNLLLGVTVLLLARTQASLYFINNIDGGEKFFEYQRRQVMYNGVSFALLFVVFAIVLFTWDGLNVDANGYVTPVKGKYFFNMVQMWWIGLMFLAGVVMVLYAIGRTILAKRFTRGIWWSGIGTVLVVLSLLLVAGFNDTAYYPSLIEPQKSLTIRNSSSSTFTLTLMSAVSVVIPVVVAYIAIVWRKLDRKPITPAEMSSKEHKY